MDYRKDVNDMLEIKGRVTTAICYAKVIEDEAIEQIRRMCDYDLTRGSKVRIMPDVHAGKGFQREQCSEGVHTMNAKVEAYNLFYRRIEDVRGPLEIPVDQGKSPMIELENSFSGNLSCYSVNTRGEFIRSYSSIEEAKMGAMYWLKVWGGIDSENVIPYGTIRSDEEEVHKRDVREAELYMTFITRYADVIEVIKKYDYPGNAADEVAAVLGITRDEVGFIYDMFDPVLFSDSRIQTIKTMLEDTL